jgi:hypothetical protein
VRRVVIKARHEEETTVLSVDGQIFGSIEDVTEHVHALLMQLRQQGEEAEVLVEQEDG